MKKIIPIIIAITIALAAIISAIVILLSRFAISKHSIDGATFANKLEEKEFITQDATSKFSDYDYIKNVTLAAPKEMSYQIEFYTFSNDEYATSFFESNKKIFEKSLHSKALKNNISSKNYSIYSLQDNGKYMYICRIDNTCVYVNVDDTFKNDVKEILNYIGY